MNFLAEATGGTGIYQYEFRDITGGGNILLQAFSTNPTYRWYTDGLAAGTYTFRVNARVVGTTTVVTTTAAFTIAGIGVTLTPNLSESATPGNVRDLHRCRQRRVGDLRVPVLVAERKYLDRREGLHGSRQHLDLEYGGDGSRNLSNRSRRKKCWLNCRFGSMESN